MTTCLCECAACETFARCDGCGALATWHWPGLSYACDACLANEDTLDNSPFKPGLTLAQPRCADDRRCPLSLCAAELMTPEEEAEFRASCQQREPYWNRDWTVLRLLSLLDAERRKRVRPHEDTRTLLARREWEAAKADALACLDEIEADCDPCLFDRVRAVRAHVLACHAREQRHDQPA